MKHRRTGCRHLRLRFISGAVALFLIAVGSNVQGGASDATVVEADPRVIVEAGLGVIVEDDLQVGLKGAEAPSETYVNVYNGWKWWHVYCYRCHGVDAVGTTNAPSLTDPSRKLTPASFLKIVRTGIPDKGMQGWDKLLDDKQIGQIHLYVRARTDKVLPPGRPDEVGPNGGVWVPPEGWPRRSR
jgi:mono/diheme cytochrome c family protein